MAFLGAEDLTIDGVSLKTYARNITTLGGTLKAPQRRGSNPMSAGRSGATFTPGKPHDVAVYTLPMWILGCNDDGAVPAGSTPRREFYKRVDELTSLLSKDGLLEVLHSLPDGTVRRAWCEVMDVLDFTTSNPNPIGRVTVQLVNNASYFEDVNTQQVTSGQLPSTSGGSTAPLDDGTFIIVGPITNPVVSNGYGQGKFSYVGTIPAGAVLTVDAGRSLVTGSGFTPDLGAVRTEGTLGRLMRLTPPSGAATGYSVTLAGTGTSGATALNVIFRRKFLVG